MLKARSSRLPFLMLAVFPALPSALSSQVIPVKTVPVAAGHQFLLFPSDRLAMGEVSLALPDTVGGVFVNPALGNRLSHGLAFSSPTYYGISDEAGSGRTLPVGALFRSGRWFGGGSLALQELSGNKRGRWAALDLFSSAWPEPLSEGSSRNLYAYGVLGRRFPEKGISVGVSGFWADLNAMEGVSLLYAGSDQIRQSGTLSDLRLGLEKSWKGGSILELLLLKSRLRMRHDVSYLNWFWTPESPEWNEEGQWARTEVENLDHTDTWGIHLAYHRPLKTPGWQVAWSLTGNWKDHPKIPNYEIQNIPRDPGETRAFGAGVGISRIRGPLQLAMEAFLEPIHSDTWSVADSRIVTGDNRTIREGEKVVENEFEFTNALVRMGGAWEKDWARLSAGLQIRSISYELDQFDHVRNQRRTQDESWMEWTPSVGVSVRLAEASLSYTLLLTTGTGLPSVVWAPGALLGPELDSSTSFLVAPSGPLSLQEVRVTSHQLSIMIPMD